MKVKYPVKYALLPIYEQTGWTPGLHELEREYGIRAYIVSKVYVKKEVIEYLNNSTIKNSYHVVFPYVRVSQYNEWQRDAKCAFSKTNEEVVDELFDTYEEAKKAANTKNKAILEEDKRKIYGSSFGFDKKTLKEKIKKIEEEYADYLIKFESIEEQILQETTDMDEKKKFSGREESVIVLGKNEAYVWHSDIYDYIQCFYDRPFRVYKISEDDFETLLSEVKRKETIMDFPDAKPLFYSSPKSGMIKIGDIYIKPDIFKTIVLDKNEIESSYLEEANRPTYGESYAYVFTTEPLEDIILSYKEHPYIRARELK